MSPDRGVPDFSTPFQETDSKQKHSLGLSTTVAIVLLALSLLHPFLQRFQLSSSKLLHTLPFSFPTSFAPSKGRASAQKHLANLVWDFLVYAIPWPLLRMLESRIGRVGPASSSEDSYGDEKELKSRALSRLVNINFTSETSSQSSPKPSSGIGLSFKGNKATYGPPGLENWNMACYQNSVIQGLASLPSFSAYLKTLNLDDAPKTMSMVLSNMIDTLNDRNNSGKTYWLPSGLKNMSSWQQQDAQEYLSKVLDELERDAIQAHRERLESVTGVEVTDLTTPLGVSPSSGQSLQTPQDREQEHSVADVITHNPPGLNVLPNELKMLLQRNPLEGLVAQRVGCLNCGYVEGLSLIPFNCLTLSLGRRWEYDIRDCLDEYTSLERIEGVECTKCTLVAKQAQMKDVLRVMTDRTKDQSDPSTPASTTSAISQAQSLLSEMQQALDGGDFSDSTLLKKCKIPEKSRTTTTKTKQAVIVRPPRSLIIHINRSYFNEYTGAQMKNNARVFFPKQLDLDEWCLGDPILKEEKVSSETWETNPSKSMLGSQSESIEQPTHASQNTYQLRSIITHFGRHDNGHYSCFKTFPDTNKEEANTAGEAEESWWEISDEQVERRTESDLLNENGVFMLFYERLELSPDPRQSNLGLEASIPINEALLNKSMNADDIMNKKSASMADDITDQGLFKRGDDDDDSLQLPTPPDVTIKHPDPEDSSAHDATLAPEPLVPSSTQGPSVSTKPRDATSIPSEEETGSASEPASLQDTSVTTLSNDDIANIPLRKESTALSDEAPASNGEQSPSPPSTSETSPSPEPEESSRGSRPLSPSQMRTAAPQASEPGSGMGSLGGTNPLVC